jgi:hypothetical protein
VDGLRGSLIDKFAYGMATDLIMVTALTAILLAVGSYFFSKIQL